MQSGGGFLNATARSSAYNTKSRIRRLSEPGQSSVYFCLQAGNNKEYLETTNAAGVGALNLTGNEIAQSITGNEIAQTITGNAGSNIINGGLADDSLAVRLGNDFFVFNTAISCGANVDRITDYNVAANTIRIENAIFVSVANVGASLNASMFHLGPAADANDFILYTAATGILSYDADGSGAGAAVQFDTVTPGL